MNPAVPVGTEVYYGCQTDWVFKQDWYMSPIVKLLCQDTGIFTKPDVWPICVDRKMICEI